LGRPNFRQGKTHDQRLKHYMIFYSAPAETGDSMSASRPATPPTHKPQIEETINRRFTIAKLIILESIGLIGFLWLVIEGVRHELHI